MILGLDVSTQKIGIAVIEEDKSIVHSVVIRFPKDKSLLEKAGIFKKEIKTLKKSYKIDKIAIEAALMMFGAKSSMASVISILQRFNGMISYIVYDTYKIEPVMVNVNSARNKLGIKIDRKIKYKNTRQKKDPIINYMVEMYRLSETPIEIELNRNKVWKDGEDDRIDALVIALSQIA